MQQYYSNQATAKTNWLNNKAGCWTEDLYRFRVMTEVEKDEGQGL